MLLRSFLLCLTIGICTIHGYSQTTSPNSDFELGDFTNWERTLGSRPRSPRNNGITPQPFIPDIDLEEIEAQDINWGVFGDVDARIQIISQKMIDPNTCGGLSTIPPDGSTGNRVARLGNEETGGGAEMLTYTISVNETNSLLLYRYAVVFQEPSHNGLPFFEVTISDMNGNIIDPTCGHKFSFAIQEQGSPTCEIITGGGIWGGGTSTIVWRDWQTVALDLSPYIGQTINVQFINSDCGGSQHWAYAYVDVETQPLKLDLSACQGDNLGTIEAPEGFMRYEWSTGQTSRQIQIQNPQDGQEFWCEMYTSDECHVRLRGTLEIHDIDVTPRDTTICEGTTATLSATGADHYTWSTGATGSSISVNPTKTTQYTVTGKTDFGCEETAIVNVTVIEKPDLTLDALPEEICIGESSTITVSGAETYDWEDGLGSSNSIVVSPTKTTTYTVTGEVFPGCKSTSSQTVTVNPIPEIDLGKDIAFCSGEANIDASHIDADSYKWSTGETSNEIKVSETGTYTLTITKNRCENYDNINVQLQSDFTIDLGKDVELCNEDSYEISVGAKYDTYMWNTTPPKKTKNITVTESGEYSVTVTDGPCVAEDKIKVTLIPKTVPKVEIKYEGKFICEPVPYTFSVAYKENEGSDPEYKWYVNDILYKTGGETLIIDTLSQTTEVRLELTNNDECVIPPMVSDAIVAPIVPPIIPELKIEATPKKVCAKTRTTFNVKRENASNDADYEWFLNGKKLNINKARFTTDTISGGSELIIRVTSHHECLDQTLSDTIQIMHNPKPVLIPQDFCLDDNGIKLNAYNELETGGTYTVTSGLATKNGAVYYFYPENAGVGSHDVDIEWTDENGCTASTNATYNVYTIEPPVVESYLEDIMGEEPYKHFEAEGDEYIYWSDENGNFLQEGKVFEPDHTCSKAACLQTFYVTQVLNPLGCRDSVEVMYYISNCVVPAPHPNPKEICNYDAPPLLTADTASAEDWPNNSEPGLSTLIWFHGPTTDDTLYIGMDGYQLDIEDLEEISHGHNDFYVRQYNLSHECISGPRKVEITINSANAPQVEGYEVCKNEFNGKTLKSKKSSETDLLWYLNKDDTSPIYSGASYVHQTDQSTSIYVTQIENGCESKHTKVDITLLPVPDPPVLNPREACEDKIHYLIAKVQNDCILHWIDTKNEKLDSEDTLYIENSLLLMDKPTEFKAYAINNDGCVSDTAITTYQVNSIPEEPVISGKDVICLGDDYGDLTTSIKQPYDKIEWLSLKNFNMVLAEGDAYSPTIDSAGTYYYATIADNKGCIKTSSKTFTVRPLPKPIVDGPKRGCVNDADNSYTVLNPKKGFIYSWSIDGPSKINGSYGQAEGFMTATIDFKEQGIDTLYVSTTDEYGCYGADTIAIRISELPVPDFNIFQEPFSSEITFQNTSIESVIRDTDIEEELESRFEWDFDFDIPIYHQSYENKNNDTTVIFPFGYYNVTLTAINDYGCIDTVSLLVHGDIAQTLYIPNTVCPTHYNQYVSTFRPKGTGLEKLDLWVYDEWGNIIWHTDDLRNGQPVGEWDCKYNGTLIQQGYYIWKAEATYIDGSMWEGQRSNKGTKSKMGHIFVFY